MFQLAEEVARRLDSISMCGRSIALKIMIRDPTSPVEPAKFLGHGRCTVQNKQAALLSPDGRATADPLVIGQHAWTLLKTCSVDPRELRGIGIQVQKLEKVGSVSSLSAAGPSGSPQKAQRKLTEFGTTRRNEGDDGDQAQIPRTPTKTQQKHHVYPIMSPSLATPTIMLQPPSQEVDPHPHALELEPDSPEHSLTEPTPLILPSLSQVDPSALQELPSELRDEIALEYRRLRSESISRSRPGTPTLALTDGTVLGVDDKDNDNSPFVKSFEEKKLKTKSGTPLSRITQALGPKSSSSISPSKFNIFERARLAASSSSSTSHIPATGAVRSPSSPSLTSAPKKRKAVGSSVKVTLEELKKLGIDASVFAALPQDMQQEQLSSARFERGFGKKR